MTGELYLPVIPLKGITFLPKTIEQLQIKDDRYKFAVENAMLNDQFAFAATLLDDKKDEEYLEASDFHEIGVLIKVKQVVRGRDEGTIAFIEVIEPARLLEITSNTAPFTEGRIERLKISQMSVREARAAIKLLRELTSMYMLVNPMLSRSAVEKLMLSDDVSEVIAEIARNLELTTEQKQKYISFNSIKERFDFVADHFRNEIEISRIKKDYEEKVKKHIDEGQKEYVLREQMRVIQEELGDSDIFSEIDEFKNRVAKLKAPKEVKEKINKEISRYNAAGPHSPDGTVMRSYIETLLDMPWMKGSKDTLDTKKAEKILNEQHYGMEKVKERLIEYIAVRAFTKGKGPTPILCLVGPPGTGKTSVAHSLAEALNKEYVRISLGGVRDEAEIRGHRRTYIGAMPGRIAKGIQQAGVRNPLMLLDEIDKLGGDFRGDPSSALLEVLDSEQNKNFRDHYIELPIDLSDVFFVATANTLETIPRPLLDRMEIIEVNSYTQNEKKHIALEHLLQKQMKAHGLSDKQFAITEKGIEKIISGYTREAGVRQLERYIGQLCRKADKALIETNKRKISITDKNISDYLGKVKYEPDKANTKDEIGIVRGLAWTSVGGETLEIEVNTMPGKGEVTLTGKMGEVMKESALTAKSYVRSIAASYGVKEAFFEKHDIHLHIPEGAVPKDGPSAGITIATAILSAVAGIKVKASVAMTGEITLRGRVLPIGGLKEKLLAAKIAGIKTVLVPEKNKADVDEISDEIKEGMTIIPVADMKQVLSHALAEKKK